MFIFVLSYSNVLQRAALNQGEICREIGLIQYTESYEGKKKKQTKLETYQRILERAGYFCISLAKVQMDFFFSSIYIFV